MYILASASPRRKEILELVGLEFKIIPSNFDESTIEFKGNLNEYSKKLSYYKAKDVFESNQEDIIIASDTIVCINNEILGKPKDKTDAFRMLKLLQNKKHIVLTSVCIMAKNKNYTFISKNYVTFDKMSDDEIIAYIETKEPMDKAGAYAIQGYAAKYIKSIHGDFYGIMGLPISKVMKYLKKITRVL